jgi:hypothetical protein
LRPWRTASGIKSGRHISQSAKIEDPGSRRIIARISHSCRTACPSLLLPLPEHGIRREAGKEFTDRVEEPTIKIQLLLRGEKTVNEALRQALELKTVLLAPRSQNECQDILGEPITPNRAERPKMIGMLGL